MKRLQRLGFGMAAGSCVVFLFGAGAGSGMDATGPTLSRDVAPIMFKNQQTWEEMMNGFFDVIPDRKQTAQK